MWMFLRQRSEVMSSTYSHLSLHGINTRADVMIWSTQATTDEVIRIPYSVGADTR
jgi:chlorite dismutase